MADSNRPAIDDRQQRDDELDFRLLFENSPDVLLVLLPDSPKFTMVAATDARLQITHTTREQTLGRGLFELFPDNPEDPTASGTSNLRASLERVLATRMPDTMPVQKYDIRGPDGDFQARFWSPKNLPVLSESGDVLYILHRVEDVTELVRAGEIGEELRGQTRAMEREVVHRSRELADAIRELRNANSRLGELDAAKTAFFSNVSHEFRTPLTLMLGPLEDSLADTIEPLGSRQRERIGLALANALRLLKLVNALLDFSRLEAGRVKAVYAPLDISRFTSDLAGMFLSAADKAGLRLRIDCPPLTEPAWVDRDMWEKIVPNLISNAFKFTLAGEIAVSVREGPECYVLEVADTGCGIPEHELPRIFERFHRVFGQTARTHEGTGIGLSLVRELVELHGGRVTAESTEGQGTRIVVEIPRGHGHLPKESISQKPVDLHIGRDAIAHVVETAGWVGVPKPEAGVPDNAASGEAKGARACVLVVDDNVDLRDYIARLLAQTFDVVTACDGQDALERIQTRKPDVVVTDLMMPRLDGFGLLRELRSTPETSSVPVIVLSARAGEEQAIEGLDAGSDDYLAKPFSARELVARVRTHVEMARARRAWILQLESANRELDSFSYSVSHDLRAPLRAISGFSHFLMEDYAGQLDEEGMSLLMRIDRATQQMADLIEGLLSLSRIGRTEFNRQNVDLTALARDIGGRLLNETAACNRNVQIRVEEGLATVGDARLLRAVLENLLGNACKYTSKTPDATIDVGQKDIDGESTFFVKDNGVGFDMAYAAKLFGAFQRLHGAAEFEGHGIGLATVQRIVGRHGGRVWAEATPGAGATFYFTIGAAH